MSIVVGRLQEPYVVVLLLMGLALANLWRQRAGRRRALLWLTLPYLALVVLSLPAAAHLAVGSLEWQHPPNEPPPGTAQAIVVLGGGGLAPGAGRTEPEMDATSVRRCLHAAALYRRQGRCLVLVSGGKPDPSVPGPAWSEL